MAKADKMLVATCDRLAFHPVGEGGDTTSGGLMRQKLGYTLAVWALACDMFSWWSEYF